MDPLQADRFVRGLAVDPTPAPAVTPPVAPVAKLPDVETSERSAVQTSPASKSLVYRKRTDDLRRRIEAGADLRHATAGQVMHAQPRRIEAGALAADAAALMEQHRITSVLVTDAAGHLVGMVHIGDLMRAKVI